MRITHPWTPEETEVVRQRYPSGGADVCHDLLPDRTTAAIRLYARRLGIRNVRLWSGEEDKILRSCWGETKIEHIAHRVGRPVGGVYLRAKLLGLKMGVPDGMESLRAAAHRCGFEFKPMVKLLTDAGVKIRNTPTRDRKGKRRYRLFMVDQFEVDQAVERWLRTETVRAAALRRGVHHNTLSRWLIEANIQGKPVEKGLAWRVPSATIDVVVADRRMRPKRRNAISA